MMGTGAIFGRMAVAGAVVAMATSFSTQRASATPVNLGTAANYAVLGVGGSVTIESDFQVYQSATVVNGNVAEGPYTTLTHGIDCTVNGRWDYDLTDANPAASGYTGNVTGGFLQRDLSGVAADARAASATATGLTPTMTISTLTDGSTLNLAAGLNVIRITGDVALKNSLTINGPAGSSVVFQLTANDAPSAHELTLSGVQMNLTGGIQAADIVWNLNGLGGNIEISSGAVVDGIFLAPDRAITSDHGDVLGELIGGGSGTLLSVHSGSEITSQSVPDGGSTVALLGSALVGLGLLRRKISRK